MPHFTLNMTAAGPMLEMIIAVSAARAQALEASGLPVPTPQNVRALLDTGARVTCIDPLVVAALSLQPTGTTTMLTPSTGLVPVDADTYDVSITIPAGDQAGLVISNMPVTASHLLLAQGFHALLGRDILQRCVVNYNGSRGFFTVAY